MHRWISQVITEYYNNYNYHISYFIATNRVSRDPEEPLSPCMNKQRNRVALNKKGPLN